MRQRILAYLTAAMLNLAIAGGTLTGQVVARVPVVRIRSHASAGARFDRGELLADGSVIVRPYTARATLFNAN